jgi:hypothetical protein
MFIPREKVHPGKRTLVVKLATDIFPQETFLPQLLKDVIVKWRQKKNACECVVKILHVFCARAHM